MKFPLMASLVIAGSFVFAGCSGATSGTSISPGATEPLARQSRQSPTPVRTAGTSLTGRIVWTDGHDTIHIYNVATKANVSLGVSGVNPKFSPDGTMIAYEKKGVYVMNSDGSHNRLLNRTGHEPSFDPTGTIIAYGDSGIWKINVDGTGRTQLTTAGIQTSSFSPDGTQIAYNASVGGNEELFIMNADGTNAHQALTSASIIDTVWRPGKILFGLAVAKGYVLSSYDPLTGTLTHLTSNSNNNDEPSWSPDATHISWTNGTSGASAGIWIMNADGTGQQGPVIAKGRQGSWGP
jgi:TolB protein